MDGRNGEDVLGAAGALSIALFSSTFDPCTVDSPGGDEVYLNTPNATGTYAISSTVTSKIWVEATTFYIDATGGTIAIGEITPTAVSGGAQLAFDGNNSLSGRFEATVCP